MESLFASEPAKHHALPLEIQRLILDLKAEHPPMRANEIATVCYVRTGRRPNGRTVERVLAENPIPLHMFRRFSSYHEIPEAKERRMAIVTLHSEGWNVKSIASYLKTSRPTVYRTLGKWIAEGVVGLDDRSRGGVRKVDLRAMNEVRRLQENPELGEFRISAALAQMGIDLSPRTCGRILAVNRRIYGLDKPKRAPKQKKEMPFQSDKRHQYWTVDIRYIDHRLPTEGKLYAISVLENHSRTLLASAISRSQDMIAYLSVLYSAVARYGSPEALITDGGGIFRARQAMALYESLGITKEEIERGKPWHSYIETTFNIQRRMADFHFARAENFEELVEAHDRWVEQYNTQKHWAHRERADGRSAPSEVLGWVSGVRHCQEELERAFFSSRFSRILDSLGYARIMHWRVYGEEGLARNEVAVWLGPESLSLEYRGETLSRYEVKYVAGSGKASGGGLRKVSNPRLFATRHRPPQLRLFELDALGESGWLKALKVSEYALLSAEARESAGPATSTLHLERGGSLAASA